MVAGENAWESSRTRGADDRVFGLQIGRFGLFAIFLLSWALGLMAFCVTCFVSIAALLLWTALGHHAVDFASSYKYVALPAGSLVTVVSLGVLLSVWVRRKTREI